MMQMYSYRGVIDYSLQFDYIVRLQLMKTIAVNVTTTLEEIVMILIKFVMTLLVTELEPDQ